MAKVSFGKTASEVPAGGPQDPSTASTAVATLPNNPVPAPYSDDNIGMEDIILPRINLVQKVGELSNQFDGGAILLDAAQVLYSCSKDPEAESPAPLNILVLGFQPLRYAEKVGGGAKGLIVNTEADVVNGGGTLDYNDAKATGKVLYQRLATALVLVEKPEGVDDTKFPHERDGKKFCTALWSMKGSGYNYGAKVIKTAKKIGHLRGPAGYRTAFYGLGTKLTSYNGQFYYIPTLKTGSETAEDFRNWIKDEVVGF